MAEDNFSRCLTVTLKWEGGYSNHPDDPGGPTMRGVIQREYDAYRRRKGKRARPVRQIEEAELQEIYRTGYWEPMGCEALPAGFDLCVFDAAVNSGVGRARVWLEAASEIDAYCERRLAFLAKTGRLWRVFGQGWRRRVAGVRAEAHRMAGGSVPEPADDTLHAGMTGEAVTALQKKLRALGYPCGNVDGTFGEQTYRAVILFQTDHELAGDPGVWQPSYNAVLEAAGPMLPKRQEATHKDLEDAGDRPVQRMNVLQRVFAWVFGASAVAQVTDASSVMDGVNGVKGIVDPLRGVAEWVSGNRWLLVAAGCAALIVLIRLLRADHVAAYRNFAYQGAAPAKEGE